MILTQSLLNSSRNPLSRLVRSEQTRNDEFHRHFPTPTPQNLPIFCPFRKKIWKTRPEKNKIWQIWEMTLRTGKGWRTIFPNLFGPPVPDDFPGKISKIIRTGDFSLIAIFGGTWYWYTNFLPCQSARSQENVFFFFFFFFGDLVFFVLGGGSKLAAEIAERG